MGIKKATLAKPEWLDRNAQTPEVLRPKATEPGSRQAWTEAKAALKVALGRMMAASLVWSGM
jgi:hypothetical protein